MDGGVRQRSAAQRAGCRRPCGSRRTRTSSRDRSSPCTTSADAASTRPSCAGRADGFEVLGAPTSIADLGGSRLRPGRLRSPAGRGAAPRPWTRRPEQLSAMRRVRSRARSEGNVVVGHRQPAFPCTLPGRADEGSAHPWRVRRHGPRRTRQHGDVCLAEAIEYAGVEESTLAAILMVGGSSRIPLAAAADIGAIREPAAHRRRPEGDRRARRRPLRGGPARALQVGEEARRGTSGAGSPVVDRSGRRPPDANGRSRGHRVLAGRHSRADDEADEASAPGIRGHSGGAEPAADGGGSSPIRCRRAAWTPPPSPCRAARGRHRVVVAGASVAIAVITEPRAPVPSAIADEVPRGSTEASPPEIGGESGAAGTPSQRTAAMTRLLRGSPVTPHRKAKTAPAPPVAPVRRAAATAESRSAVGDRRPAPQPPRPAPPPRQQPTPRRRPLPSAAASSPGAATAAASPRSPAAAPPPRRGRQPGAACRCAGAQFFAGRRASPAVPARLPPRIRYPTPSRRIQLPSTRRPPNPPPPDPDPVPDPPGSTEPSTSERRAAAGGPAARGRSRPRTSATTTRRRPRQIRRTRLRRRRRRDMHAGTLALDGMKLVAGMPRAEALVAQVKADPLAGLTAGVLSPGGCGKTVLLDSLRDIYRAAGVDVLEREALTQPVERRSATTVLMLDDAHAFTPAELRRAHELIRIGTSTVLAFRPWPRTPELIDAATLVRRSGPLLVLGHLEPRTDRPAGKRPSRERPLERRAGRLSAAHHRRTSGAGRSRAGRPRRRSRRGRNAGRDHAVDGRPRRAAAARRLDDVRLRLLHAVAVGADLDTEMLVGLLDVPGESVREVVDRCSCDGSAAGLRAAVAPLIGQTLRSHGSQGRDGPGGVVVADPAARSRS